MQIVGRPDAGVHHWPRQNLRRAGVARLLDRRYLQVTTIGAAVDRHVFVGCREVKGLLLLRCQV